MANQIKMAIRDPFFKATADTLGVLDATPLYQDLDNPFGIGSQFADQNRACLLAEMIPALSFATGANVVPKLNEYSQTQNVNMQHRVENGQVVDEGLQNGWPVARVNDGVNGSDWLHGDYKTVAYVYVYKVFDAMTTMGNFDQ